MAGNIIRDDDATTVIEAVGSAYSSGDFIVEGLLHGVSLNDVSNGDNAVVQSIGEIQYAKTAGQTWAEGQELYFDQGTDKFTTVATADGLVHGFAAEDAVLAATTGKITLCEVHSGAGYVDDIEDRVTDLESDKMDLVGTPTAGNLIEMDAAGQGVDSGVATSDVQVLTVPAAAGNLASLDVSGALDDSGVAAADVQVLTVPASADNIATLSATGVLQDGGLLISRVSDLVTIDLDRVRRSTNTAQSLADGVAAEIAFEDIEVTGDVTVDVTNKQFTIPATGMYEIFAELTFATSGGGTTRGLTVYNGTTLILDDDQTPGGVTPDVVRDSGWRYCVATDVITVKGLQDSGGALDVTGGRIAIQRIQ